jgi:uncharacterized membrane protein
MLNPNRRLLVLILFQLLLCWYETYLISKISTIGKIGIATTYHQYHWLRVFWLTYTILTVFQLALILTLFIIGKRSTKKMTNLVSTIFLVAGGLGLVLTFQDFLHTYSHRLLKERFHLGFYIFWICWMGSCLYFLFSNQTKLFPLDPNAPLISQPQHPEQQPAPYMPSAERQPSPPGQAE